MGKCGYCGLDSGARPYARAKDGAPSVTTVLEVADFGAKARKFAWAATEIAAVMAVHEGHRWAHEGTEGCTRDHDIEPGLCPACRLIRSEFDRQWRAKANLGNHVHHLGESWAKGEPIEVDGVSEPYIDALAAWYEAVHPQFELVEATLLYDAAQVNIYRGTADMVVEVDCPLHDDRCRWLVDLKTTEGWWDLDWRLQLAAYQGATWVTSWDSGEEVKVTKMPLVVHAGILQLRSDGTYRFEALEVGATEHNVFIRLRQTWAWERAQTIAARETKKAAKKEAASA